MTGRHPYKKTDLTAYLYVIKSHMRKISTSRKSDAGWLFRLSFSLCQMVGKHDFGFSGKMEIL